jgi:hypothetical protein
MAGVVKMVREWYEDTVSFGGGKGIDDRQM